MIFLGTAVHRTENGQNTWRLTACAAVIVVAFTVCSAYQYGDGDQFTRRAWIVAFYAVLLPLCMLTHRCIEAPAQSWGRELARRVPTDLRSGPAPFSQ
ncbi:hypothetical protein [Streptomyces sp. NPDC057199]|uniref:hypothetical protein n=1 Tax=Streptomyces sp. NPDC057199 TaxID=3346047 RepID=UPI003635E106